MIDILLSAFLLSVVLVGIHSFFGLEIIKRGIIFTDLAVGQMAAFGAAVSLYFFNGEYLYLLSFTFAVAGGILIAITARKSETHEAFIGLLYAFGLSGAYILLSKSPNGIDEFQKLMASDILIITYWDIFKISIIYACIGILLFLLYRRTSGFIKEALFFVLFSITVTSSVRLAGVLVVFALLVSPAYIAIKMNKGILLFKAWLIGIFINFFAIIISYKLDIPTGYAIVAVHTLCAIVISLVKKPLKKNDLL